jgi:hypothetical protein
MLIDASELNPIVFELPFHVYVCDIYNFMIMHYVAVSFGYLSVLSYFRFNCFLFHPLTMPWSFLDVHIFYIIYNGFEDENVKWLILILNNSRNCHT